MSGRTSLCLFYQCQSTVFKIPLTEFYIHSIRHVIYNDLNTNSPMANRGISKTPIAHTFQNV